MNAKRYEPGMRITYDPRKKTVSVAFRGKLAILNGEFATEDAGIAAGEDYCRKQGWVTRSEPDSGGRSLIRRTDRP